MLLNLGIMQPPSICSITHFLKYQLPPFPSGVIYCWQIQPPAASRITERDIYLETPLWTAATKPNQPLREAEKKPKSSPLAISNTDGQKRVVILWSNVKTHLFRLLCRAHNRTQLRIHGMHILTAYKRSSSNGCLHRQRMYRHVKPGGLHWKITWRYPRVTTATRNRSKPIKLGKYLLLFLFTQAGGRVRFPPLRHLWAKPKGPPTTWGGSHSL